MKTQRSFMKSVSVLTGTPTYAAVVAARSGYRTFVTKITLSITTHVAGDRYIIDDDGEDANPIAAHTDATAAAMVKSKVVWDFGKGTPVKLGANVDVSHSGTGVARIAVEGYYEATSDAWASPLSYSEQVIADGASAYWRLGEASGTSAADATGNGNTGTYVNTPTLGVAGAVSGDTAVTFASASAEHLTTLADATDLPSSAWSMEAWFRTSTTGARQNILVRTTGSRPGLFVFSNNRVLCQVFDGAINVNVSPTATVTDGLWHHVVGTYDGVSIRVYLDGVLGAGPTASNVYSVVAGTFYIGIQQGLTEPFDGTLDEVALYPLALTAAQVLDHYKARF